MTRDETATRVDTAERPSGLSDDAIREQLDRIATSPEFHATEKVRNFLRFVVEEKLAGRSNRIKGYTIATRVFGRGDDFDASQDPIVRIQAGRLRRALERYYLVAGGDDPILIDIPKGRYIPFFSANTRGRDHARRETPIPSPQPGRAATEPSVAVLPLEDLNGDPEQRFFAVGLAQDLVTELSRFQDITVISRQGGQETTGSARQPAAIDGSSARFMLRGTVRRDPKMIKVAMQLVDTTSGQHLWADAYTHPLEAGHLIATQEDIARSVVAAIGSEYGIIARRLSAESRKKPPAELDTYQAMLRYYTHQTAPTPESAASCFEALRRAVDREPEYGPAWSALATLHCQMYTFDAPGFEDALDIGLRYARRGVSLEPGSQLGRLILAYASYLNEDDAAFEAEIENALALNPNSSYTVGTVGYFHIMRGEPERGLPLLDRAIAANPCHPNWFYAGHVIVFLLRQECERALEVIDNHKPYQGYSLPLAYAAILGSLGRIDQAAPYVEQVIELKPDVAARARELLRRSLKIDTLIDKLVDGLRQAGMRVDVQRRPHLAG